MRIQNAAFNLGGDEDRRMQVFQSNRRFSDRAFGFELSSFVGLS
jgi:hypothetical protein